jgi:HlyD family secretion protein
MVAAAIVITLMLARGNGSGSTYQFAEVTRGDLENTISATGTVNPVSTVEVGTQVSGIIDVLNVDFNDVVRKGQILAVLDTSLLKAAVLDARAQVDRNQALHQQALADEGRNRPLFEKGFISEQEFLPLEIAVKTTRAGLQSAQVALDRAETNLSYAVIRSPIDGTVIEKAVEEGQTVAASLQAPVLFIIAEDLSQMEIHAQVDESDIGSVLEGQAVRFDVQAYPDEIFTGTVKQVRLQPATVQNVVNYTVVVDAPNPDGLLLPGMTATIDFVVEQRENVLLVSSAALRLQPTQEMMEQLRRTMRQRFESLPDSVKNLHRAGMSREGPPGGGSIHSLLSGENTSGDIAALWFFDQQGCLNMLPVRKGTTDGQQTEITALQDQADPAGGRRPDPLAHRTGAELREGLQVIGAVTGAATQRNSGNQSRRPMFGGRPPF